MSILRKAFCLGILLLVIPLVVWSQELTLESVNEAIRMGNLRFSPVGSELALLSNRSGASKIWMMSPDGSDARMLLDDDGSESDFTWSPDGQRIAFVRFDDGQSDVWVVDSSGDNLRKLTNDPGSERGLSWSPQGNRIAFISNRQDAQDVFTVDVASGTVTQVTEQTSAADEYRWSPAWSPDGEQIAYVSNRSERWHDDVWLVNVDSKETHKATADLHVMTNPIWSPDGSHIAFNAMKRSEFWYGDQNDIYVIEMPDERVRKVDMNTYVSDRNGSIQMAWAPDSEQLYFRYQWEGDDNLWTVHVEGGVATKMTYEKGTLGNFTVSHDGSSVAYVRELPTRRGEVHRLDLAGGAPTPITDWQTDYPSVQAPDKITFRSRDGKYILGYLYTPPDFDPSGTYPALVQVHGGGNNAYANGFHTLEHLMAQNGYVVMAIEYRGSAGHGRAFQDLSYGDWAAEQGWDAVAAAEYLKSQPYSNGRVGIYGGSYGGIMTMAALTRDAAPFNAAAPFYGIYDWATAYEDGDYLMRFWVIEGHQGYKPSEKPELYERTASIRHLEEVPTDLPFLIIHGEMDRRAPFNQSVRLVDSLEARGNPVQFHSYPEERHGFRKPENRLHAYGNLMEFFNAHLKGSSENTEG